MTEFYELVVEAPSKEAAEEWDNTSGDLEVFTSVETQYDTMFTSELDERDKEAPVVVINADGEEIEDTKKHQS